MVAEVKTGEKAFDQEESRQTFNTRDQGEFLAKKKKKKTKFQEETEPPTVTTKDTIYTICPFWVLAAPNL